MKTQFFNFLGIACMGVLLFTSCEDEKTDSPQVKDPATAEEVAVDRFSKDAGHLMVRTDENGLPGSNEAINYDQVPFITKGLGPDGNKVEYYNFDVQPTAPAPIYVLFKEGENAPVDGQLNIINVIPGDSAYNDFWLVTKVTVPASYVANTVTSLSEITTNGYTMTETDMIVNCPVVPKGSTAAKRYGAEEDAGLTMGWYKGKVVYYFNFLEKSLTAQSGKVPTSPIYVTFNINPDEDGGGPPSGFVTETGSEQTHNVVETDPDDAEYSPLWKVNIYDNASFDNVSDLTSAMAAPLKAEGAALVNCPIVYVE